MNVKHFELKLSEFFLFTFNSLYFYFVKLKSKRDIFSPLVMHSKLSQNFKALNYRKNMARPKDKFRSQIFGDAFLDKSERERSRLKLTLAKQMQKDIGRYICLIDRA